MMFATMPPICSIRRCAEPGVIRRSRLGGAPLDFLGTIIIPLVRPAFQRRDQGQPAVRGLGIAWPHCKFVMESLRYGSE